MKKNLHLMLDEKFIDYFIRIAEEIQPGNNRYIVYLSRDNKTLEYVKDPRVETCFWKEAAFLKIYRSVDEYEKIFIHNLSSEMVTFINRLGVNPRVKIFWVIWGLDLFRPTFLYWKFLYDPYTRQFLLKAYPWLKFLPLKWAEFLFLKAAKFLRLEEYRQRRAAIGRIDYCLHWNKLDLDLLQPHYKFRMIFLEYNYFNISLNIDKILKPVSGQLAVKDQGTNLLIGNSALPTNNHADLFLLLKKQIDISAYNFYSILSYGPENYKEFVLSRGREILGKNFKPITKFMPITGFFELLQTVTAGVFANNRTQAGGNVLSLLLMGKKVFLKKENTVYQMYRSLGAHIFKLEELTDSELQKPLSRQQIEDNIRIGRGKFGLIPSREKLKKILSIRDALDRVK
jgi:hypothetical protein